MSQYFENDNKVKHNIKIFSANILDTVLDS